MKKLLVIGAAAGAAYAVFRRFKADSAEQDLWAEATREPDLR